MLPTLPRSAAIERPPLAGLALCGLALALLACSPDAAPPARETDVEADPDTSAPPAEADPGAPTAGAPAPTFAEDGSWVLSAEGVGPLRFGMELEELRPYLADGADTFALSGECAYARVRDAPAGLELMVVEGRLVRAEVLAGRTPATGGIRVGDPEARVRDAYAGRAGAVRESPRKYTAGRSLLVLPGFPDDTVHRFVFETDERRVTELRAGLYPAVEWVEGCG